MRQVSLPLLAILVAGSSGLLNPQDLGSYDRPRLQVTTEPSALSSSLPASAIVENPYSNPFSQGEEASEDEDDRKTQGNLRKSFSFVPIKKRKEKARYENETDNVESATILVRKRKNKNTTTRSISGPNVDGQQPYRHWSTESNIIREEHPDGLYSSYPYIKPANSGQNTDFSRNNLHKAFELSTTEGYEPSKPSLDINNKFGHRAIVPATTYRPARLFRPVTTSRTPTTDGDGYSFSFSSRNGSRYETGDAKGNFRGTIKFINTYEGDKEIDYEGNPNIGIVSTQRPPIVNIGSARRLNSRPTTFGPFSDSPSTPLPLSSLEAVSSSRAFSSPWPQSTPRPGLSYSFNSPATGLSYSSNPFANNPTPYSATSLAGFVNRRGKNFYEQPLFDSQPLQTYVTPSMETYMYNQQTPQYVLMQPNYGSYMFRYDAGDHRRSEARDGEGNVQGTYSFEGTDGERKQVTYEANSEKGFVAHGRHLPLQPQDIIQTYQSTPSPNYSPTENPGTYYFSYNAGEHMRQERKDEFGNINGVYSYLTADGQRKTVKYRASAKEGFVATGDDIPLTEDGSYSYRLEQPTYPSR